MKLSLAAIVIALLTGCAGHRPTIYVGPPSNSTYNNSMTCSGTGAMKTCHHGNGQVTQCFNNGATLTCNTF